MNHDESLGNLLFDRCILSNTPENLSKFSSLNWPCVPCVPCVRGPTCIQCELKKQRKRNNQDSIQNLPKLTRKFMKLSVDDSIFIFCHMVHWSFILGQGWLLSSHFCKACQNCLHPSFALLLCCESSLNAIMQRKQCQIGQNTILTCFTNLIAVQPSMTKYEWTLYQMKVK